MASVFSEWTLEDCRLAVQLSSERAKELKEYQAAIAGDLWQDWEWWIGPVPDPTDPDAKTVLAEIQRGFVSRNVLSEVVGRHCNGVVGRDVKYSLVPRRDMEEGEQPTSDEETLIKEATTLLNGWVEERKLNQEYDKVCETLLIAGTAYQRPFVPPGEIGEDGTIPQADLATSLGRVYVHFPQPGEAVIYTDPRTQRKCSIYFYKEATSSRPSEAKNNEGDERAELTYLDGDVTVVRIVGKDGTIAAADDTPDYRFALGNRLLMSDMQRKPLLNPQVVSQQKLLNLALTMKERNVILGGFLERVAINAQMNGTYETGSDGVRRFVPDALPVGAGAMTTLTGYVTRDAEGKETLATPHMLWRDPVDVKTFLDTEASSYRHILAECNQLHYGASGDAGISAESRLVSMAAYLIDLLQTKQQMDSGWSWLLETALSLAAVLSGQPGRFDGLRVSAECSVDAGPISSDMMQTAFNLAGGKPLLSVQTAQEWIGIEDTSGEQAQIVKEMEEESAQMGQNPDVARVQDIVNRVRGNGAGDASKGNGAQGQEQPVTEGV